MFTTGRLAALTAFFALALLVPGAHAIPTDPDDTENLPPCLHKFSVPSFGVTAARVDLGETTTLAWRIAVPAECRNQLSFTLNGQFIGLEGSRRLTPMANTTYTLQVRGPGGLPRTIDTATIRVVLPDDVTIDRNDQQPLFEQAVGTAGTTVRVANGVQLDLSRYENISVAAGVTLLGGRTARSAGPRLYTTTRPKRLLIVTGDDVRISGLRIHGPDMGVADGDGGPATGLYVSSRNDVEIDHNEIAGWKNAAVGVNDENNRISYVLNPDTVRIHDNFIHHNQRTGGFGYGVVIGDGAYALIDRNVFDYNRHAIASDGSDDSGYRAYENLVLENGGKHRKILWKWYYTHQFDVHGQESCGVFSLFSDSLYNCGRAGHDVEIRRNSFLYTKDNAFKLRGTPQLKPHGAFVYDNVFKHDDIDDAITQNESGMTQANNRLDTDGLAQLGRCDFDGDGLDDKFLATGRNWWYQSRISQWNYYGTSNLMLSQVRLADVNGDGRCDVNPR
jgi:Right handed beta helix region